MADERRQPDNQRYSPLTEINRDNVGALKGVWRTRLRGSGLGPQYSGEAQPLVYDGVIYIVTGANDVFAVERRHGEDPLGVPRQPRSRTSTRCAAAGRAAASASATARCSSASSTASSSRSISAPARSPGRSRPSAGRKGFTIPSAPLYYDGLVITGFAGAERGIRGRVKAFDAKNGKLVWTFYTIPGPGEVGHETWPKDNELWQDGGASVWHTPAVDPGARAPLLRHRQPGPRLQRLGAQGRQPVLGVDRRGRREDRQIPLALPARAPRHLGLRRGHAARAVRPQHRRTAAQRHRAAEQDRLGLHSRPRDRQAARRHRRAARAAGAAAGHGADAAVSARRRVRAAVDRHRARRARRSSTRGASSRRSGRRRCR